MAEYVEPGTAYTSRVFGLTTGLEGTVRFRLIDNDSTADDPIYGPDEAGIVEDPAGSGSYVFSSAAVSALSPATEGKYSRVWDSGAATELVPDEDLIVLSGVTDFIITGDTYATQAELFRVLKIRTPTTEQEDAADRVLLAATGEIDSEINLADDADALAGWQLALAAEVCLERAVEHWQQGGMPFGILGLDSATGGIAVARDSWERHAMKLAPLKDQWGLA